MQIQINKIHHTLEVVTALINTGIYKFWHVYEAFRLKMRWLRYMIVELV